MATVAQLLHQKKVLEQKIIRIKRLIEEEKAKIKELKFEIKCLTGKGITKEAAE